jgi:hypothetical protein
MTDKNTELIRDIAIDKTVEYVEKLESSNSELKVENSKLENECLRYDRDLKQAEAENAELRKEVEELRECHESELGVCQQHCDVVKEMKARLEKLEEIEGKLLFTAECLEGHAKKEGCKGVFHWINNSASLIRDYVKEMRELEKEEKK